MLSFTQRRTRKRSHKCWDHLILLTSWQNVFDRGVQDVTLAVDRQETVWMMIVSPVSERNVESSHQKSHTRWRWLWDNRIVRAIVSRRITLCQKMIIEKCIFQDSKHLSEAKNRMASRERVESGYSRRRCMPGMPRNEGEWNWAHRRDEEGYRQSESFEDIDRQNSLKINKEMSCQSNKNWTSSSRLETDRNYRAVS
jgi:hypothetical protein